MSDFTTDEQPAGLFRIREGQAEEVFATSDTGVFPLAEAPPDGTWLRISPNGTSEILALAGSALAGLYDLAAAQGLSPLHSPAAVAEAERLHLSPGIDDPTLVDLCELPFLTIDEPSSRDLDQALCVEPLGENEGDDLRVYYAIADASHFARPGTSLLAEALERGSTYYLPGLILPMLPASLSEDLVSLNPDVDRRALVFKVDIGADGEVKNSHLLRARIHSRLKSSYDAVQDFYNTGSLPGAESLAPELKTRLEAGLEALKEVGERRLRLAAMRDTIRLRRRELSVRLDDQQHAFIAMGDPRNDAERYNEQISLLCNIVGARLLSRRHPDLQPIFRFHQPPDDFKLNRFKRESQTLIRRHRLEESSWSWRRGEESLADYLARLPHSGPHARVAMAIHRQAMLAGGRAGFDTAPGIHHGVGAEAYARFTAPMREVVGVFVHKEALEVLGLEPAAEKAADEALRELVVRAAERSRGLQRKLDSEVNRRLLDQLFGGDLKAGDTRGHTGTILGISRSKVHVQLDEPPIDVKIYFRHLEVDGERLEQGRDRVTVRRRNGQVEWIVGDGVRVRAAGHDSEHDRWRLEMLPADGL